MQSKSLLIAIAAFAVTATGVHAYAGTKIPSRVGLNEDQIEALQEARELQALGDVTAARDRLLKAGITDDNLRRLHRAAMQSQSALQTALENNDYKAFRLAVVDLPLADIITTEEDFRQFKEAHDLKQTGSVLEAGKILNELGLESNRGMKYGVMKRSAVMVDLSPEQKEAFMVAKQSNDRATMQAILDEAGVDFSKNRRHMRF